MTATSTGRAEAVASIVERLQAEADVRRKGASILGPLGKDKTHEHLEKLERAIQTAREKCSELDRDPEDEVLALIEQTIDEVAEVHRARVEAVRDDLGRELNAACKAAGLKLRVLGKEGPIRLRIAPFGVVIDRDAGTAKIEFGQVTLAQCPAEAEEIVKAHAKVKQDMGAFDPAEFFAACRRAWRGVLATGRGGSGDRVEIMTFLPYLALEKQPNRFRRSPSAEAFVAYTRGHFAFDVMRLREARALSQDGWRFNLGVATGASASSTHKSNVVWIENADGDGEYKLTIFFQRNDDA